jgi:acyl-CoA synthetase (AMP-forming)/AMP-acid ligase II/thioesterase domain-containing protein
MSAKQDTITSNFAEFDTAGIAGLLLRTAALYPTSGVRVIGVQAPETEFLPYPALLREAKEILGGLQQRSGRPGAKIVLVLDRPRDFIPTFWACVLGGYVPCPVAPIRNDPERWAKHLAHIDTLLDHPIVVSAGALLDELPATLATARLQDLRKTGEPGRLHCAKNSELALLMLTSGSTGSSKAVELTHANLLASMEGRAERQQLTSADITFNWIAFDHVAALLESHMIALYVGATQLHAEPAAILTDPLQFLRLIDQHRTTLAFAPNFLLGQVNDALEATQGLHAGPDALKLDLSCLRRIVTGGEANVVATGKRFLELLAPYGLARTALWPAFGMTETCAASVYSHQFPDADATHEFAAVGLPIKGLEIRLVDENGQPCPAGLPGALQLRGPMIFRRYYHNEAATRDAFTADGWFDTGDIGRIEQGLLSLVARNKDSIIVSGVNYYGHELESQLEQLDGIQRSFVAAFPTRPSGADTEQLVVTFATTLAPEDEAGLHQLIVAIRNTTIMLWGFRPALILALPPSAFPKTSLGKIQRALMRKRLEAGEFTAQVSHIAALTERQIGPYRAPETGLEAELAQVFASILKVDVQAVSTTASFFDLGGTSLDILRLAQALQRFGLKDAIPVVLQNPTVSQLAGRISAGARLQTYDPIVPLQTTGKKTPLFCVHPGNGEVFVLVNLAKYFLQDRPFYALRPRGFNEGEEHFSSIQEMVQCYVDAILKRQPQGPYAIAGYSLGAQIAFEIAQRLEVLGHDVRFLASIDGRPLHEPTPTLPFNMAVGLALVTDLITLEQSQQLLNELDREMPNDTICEYILKYASPQRMAELGLDMQKFALWARVAHSVESLVFAHQKTGTVNAMTIFCSEGISSNYTPEPWTRHKWRSEHLQHWDAYVGTPTYIDVPGHHHTLMSPKYVAAFQTILRAQLDAAMQDH